MKSWGKGILIFICLLVGAAAGLFFADAGVLIHQGETIRFHRGSQICADGTRNDWADRGQICSYFSGNAFVSYKYWGSEKSIDCPLSKAEARRDCVRESKKFLGVEILRCRDVERITRKPETCAANKN
ncbi:hypothetical protein [Novosphingobium sediminicola]|uniref:Uncharacterized protein n=1 Tax=Novosphingobium sediminicola TaxID=563162 RepID=A0A7W6CEZ6_9SPHN|nr:hypothetical protein [Novosphingobium sediminicola]MBB3955308.1 hypothetical protein [Novosphingobium sediminicola]